VGFGLGFLRVLRFAFTVAVAVAFTLLSLLLYFGGQGVLGG
jgi:hypothetical protein